MLAFGSSRRARREELDAVAAGVLLESYFEAREQAAAAAAAAASTAAAAASTASAAAAEAANASDAGAADTAGTSGAAADVDHDAVFDASASARAEAAPGDSSLEARSTSLTPSLAALVALPPPSVPLGPSTWLALHQPPELMQPPPKARPKEGEGSAGGGGAAGSGAGFARGAGEKRGPRARFHAA